MITKVYVKKIGSKQKLDSEDPFVSAYIDETDALNLREKFLKFQVLKMLKLLMVV